MRIEEIPLDEHLLYKERIGVCFACEGEYAKRHPRSKYCDACKKKSSRLYNQEWYGIHKRKTDRPHYELNPNQIFIPEEFRGDKWATGMYLMVHFIICCAITDSVKDCSRIRSGDQRAMCERNKEDAVLFFSGRGSEEEMRWLNGIFEVAGVNMESIRKRLKIKDEGRMVA